MANVANTQVVPPSARKFWRDLPLTLKDMALAQSFIGVWREPDVTIAPDGEPYLYRWHLIPRNADANCYFHIQIASDPERPLHDHPWDNMSVILSGGYREILAYEEDARIYHGRLSHELLRQKGDVTMRKAETAHRLILPSHVPYTMTLFTTGPHRRDWGFWFPDGWRSNHEVVFDKDGMSQFLEPRK